MISKLSPILFGLSMMFLASGSAMASLEVDNFDLPPSGGFNNSLLQHQIDEPYFAEGWYVSPSWSLGLVAAKTDMVTFNLAPGEYVDYAGVHISSNNATAEFEAIGTEGSYLASWTHMEWRWFDTIEANIGKITSLRLMGFESVFDDLTINIVPEPIEWRVQDGGNGHLYELIYSVNSSGGITWDEAKAEAESRTWLGISGYLAAVTSGAENDFIKNDIIVEPDSPWIGGHQPAGSPEPAGGWEWVTGEPWSYTNWSSDEPNNLGGNENALQFSWDRGWNDVNKDTLLDCYIVEYIPEPATLGLLAAGTGLLVAGRIRRRRRR